MAQRVSQRNILSIWLLTPDVVSKTKKAPQLMNSEQTAKVAVKKILKLMWVKESWRKGSAQKNKPCSTNKKN